MASSSTNVGAPSSSRGRRLSWPPEPIPPFSVGYLSRKALPIKRNDAEMLTREDIQYNLLEHIFSDTSAVFTPPPSSKSDATRQGPLSKISFKELYTNTLYNSPKCSKVVKEKMVETPAFAVELAKISLLTNVGRINTTMAFFPEMKTALRTYHPVPSLQKTDGNAQDAPRIKNCLKAALLPHELPVPPSSPEEVLERLVSLFVRFPVLSCLELPQRAGQRPPTSVVNLVFVLSNHTAPLAARHFDGTFNFLDLFIPKHLSSSDRARTFLWLMYHYLESSEGTNPFDDNHSRENPPKAPFLRTLSAAEMATENVDTREEIEWGKKMSGQRNIFLRRLVSTLETDKKNKATAPHFVPATPHSSTTSTGRAHHQRRGSSSTKEETPFMYYVPGQEQNPPIASTSSSVRRHATRSQPEEISISRTIQPEPIIRPRSHTAVLQSRPLRRYFYPTGRERTMIRRKKKFRRRVPSVELKSLGYEEPDEHVRADYARRLDVLNRLRQKTPTPEPAESGDQMRDHRHWQGHGLPRG
ncbi:hypothetical protein E1B28_001266 [Marasmius oreades]|uniref:Ino eighty subunit 1 n=1 Tax=Marasmius oreades TaxID=181124 RepID=A0A9P7V331_9AGAR|nr:uncharacterized protein E1B28_001266 [Marasmius oreades]KAG7099413.1 hypothetical protein E1B28_001266 [Marasmius oreades]